MSRIREWGMLVGTSLVALALSVSPMRAQAAEWVHEGMADEDKMTVGFRWPEFSDAEHRLVDGGARAQLSWHVRHQQMVPVWNDGGVGESWV